MVSEKFYSFIPIILDKNNNNETRDEEKEESKMSTVILPSIIGGIAAPIIYLLLLMGYEYLLFGLFYGFEKYKYHCDNYYFIEGNIFKQILFIAIIVIPALPLLIVWTIAAIFIVPHDVKYKRKDAKRNAKRRLDLFLKDLDEFGNLKKHKFHTVTRWEVDNFVFDNDSNLLNDFDYLDTGKSFSKRVNIKGSKDGVSNSSNSEIDLISDGCTHCAVCLEPFEKDEDLILFPCNHYFHEFCLKGFRTATRNRKPARDESTNFRCIICRLNLARHYCFYMNYGLDPGKIHFQNKVTTSRKLVIQDFKDSEKTISLYWSCLKDFFKKI